MRRGCWIVFERIAKAVAEGTHLQSQVRPVGRRHFGTHLQRGKSFAASLFLYAVLQYTGTQYTSNNSHGLLLLAGQHYGMLHAGNVGHNIILREKRPHGLQLLILTVRHNYLYPVSQNAARLMHH